METSCDLKFPATHHWFIAQNLESHKQLFYTVDTPPQYHHQCRINELHGRRIRACFHNWLILSNHPDSVLWSLWNPLTSTLIRLPPLIHQKQENHSHECCLSAPPDHEASVLLLTKAKVPTIVFCHLGRKRKRLKWTEMSYAKQLRSISAVEYDSFLESPTCSNGKVYAIFNLHVIQVDILLKGKQVVISFLPLVEIPYATYNRCPPHKTLSTRYSFLKGSCPGPLFFIKVGYKGETSKTIVDVYLFTLDMTSMTWEEMLDLKDAVFLLQLATGYSACYYGSAADSGGYVHILGESAKMICSFHAKDRTVTASSMPCMVLESQASTWVMLEWRLESDHAESEQHLEHKDTEIIARPVKGDNIDIDSTTGESRLLDIPFHMLETIMELCVGVEYMKFRATCTRCSLAAPPIQWSSTTALRRLQMYSLASPWLMVLDNYQEIITFTDPLCGDMYFIRKPQQLKGDYHIYCSKYGWLLMYKYEHDPQLAFFNPFTSNIRKLPVVPYLDSFCFSAPPTSPDCMVVGFATSGQWHVFIHFVSREPTWSMFRLDFGGDDPSHYRFPTFNGPDVYALCNNKGVDAFRDITAPGVYSWEAVVDDVPESHCRPPTQYFLSSCDQHVLVVTVGELGESVEVFKLNESTEEWEKIENLGKHMIYISSTSCICLEAKSAAMGNKIYFPRLLNKDGTKIVFYSLDTGKYHTFNDQNVQQSFGAPLLATKYLCNPHTWIQPSWS